jgi:hypothetical protein
VGCVIGDNISHILLLSCKFKLNGLITLLLHVLVQLLNFLSHMLCLETQQRADSEADKNYQFILDWCILAADSI